MDVPMEMQTILFGGLLLAGLVALSVVDLRTRRLPDALTFPLMAVGLGWGFASGQGPASVIGMVAGYAALVAIELTYERLRGQRGLGRGDAKLAAVAGAWCGWAGLPLVVLVGSASALVAVLVLGERLTDARGRMAFGPFLAFGTAMVWLAQRLA